MDKEAVYYSMIERNAFGSVLTGFWFTFGDTVKIRESSSWINKICLRLFTLSLLIFALLFGKSLGKDSFFWKKHQTNRHYDKTPLSPIYPLGYKVPFLFPKCYLFSHKCLTQDKSPVFQKMPFSPTPYHLLSSVSTRNNCINAEEGDVECSMKTYKTFWN